MSRFLIPILLVVLLALWVVFSAAFTLRPNQQVAVFRFSELVRVVDRPGLHFKIPLLDNNALFSKAVYEVSREDIEVAVRNNEPIVIDYYFTYRITDLRTLISLNNGNLPDLETKLAAAAFSSIQADIDERSQQEILEAGRQEVREVVFQELKEQEPIYGVEIIDFRMNRVDLPSSAKQEVENSMRQEREAEVEDIRSRANASAAIIRAEADRQAGLIVARARQEAQAQIGLGTQLEIQLKNEAFSIDPEFFTFYKRVEEILSGAQIPQGRFTVADVDTFLQEFLGYNQALGKAQGLNAFYEPLRPIEVSPEVEDILQRSGTTAQ